LDSAHEPARVFERAAKHFASSVNKRSNGRINVTIVDASTVSKTGVVSAYKAFQMVQRGELEMSQTYTTSLGKYENKLWVVDLPFLFRDHNHAANVLDGKLGQTILAGLDTKGIKGLGFTYSGGYRIIPSKEKPISSVEDFKDLKIRVSQDSPVAYSYLKELGAKPIQVSDINTSSKGIDGFETTYARLENIPEDDSKFINETEHSLFLTTIIINKKFFDRLPSDLQKIVKDSVLDSAKLERADSIQDGLATKEKYKKDGLQFTSMSSEEKAKMKSASENVYKKYEALFGKQLIADIQNTK
jgi:TRAP-type C4-dicarboxylate transport system substrate-binding protein